MTELVRMSRKEQLCVEVLARVKSGQITRVKAAELLKICYRQVLRRYGRYAACGAAGLVHQLRGRVSNNRSEAGQRRRVLEAYRKDYGDFGPTLACEELARRQKLKVDHETLRRWLLAEGLWARRRQRQKHRSRREPRAHVGELVQMDGSPHDWLEGRGPRCVLMELVDDATGRTYGRFYPEETTAAVMDVFGRYVGRCGLPLALYVDKDGIYVVNNREPTGREILSGKEPLTQFGRAAAALGVELITADSPQAKGRVERVHGTQQDRLVKLLRLEGITTLAGANAYLEKTYWKRYNGQFSRVPAQGADLHRKAPARPALEEILSHHESRTVGQDWCVCYRKRVLQIAPAHQGLALAGQALLVLEKLDGMIVLKFKGRSLTYKELAARPIRLPLVKVAVHPGKVYRPGRDHPFNAPYGRRAALGASAAPASAAPRPAPPRPPTPLCKRVTFLSS